MLAEIERSNFFLVALDAARSEYRYHRLFAAVLARQLDIIDPDSVAGVHARASLWFEEHEDVEHAIDHAIACREIARASRLVMSVAVPLLSIGRMATVNRWSDSLSWPEAQSDRELAMVRALSARLSGRGRDEVERWLRIAEDWPGLWPTRQRNHIHPLRCRDGELDVPQSRYRRRRSRRQTRARERAGGKRVAIRGPRATGTGPVPRRSK